MLLLLYLNERYQIYSIRYVFFSGKPGKPIAQDRKKTTHLVYSELKLSPNQEAEGYKKENDNMIITRTTFDMTVLYPENQQILGFRLL